MTLYSISEKLKNFVKQKNSYFITVEGLDGSGKSTQIQIIKTWLNSKGLEVFLTREPGGSLQLNEIRKLLIRTKYGYWDGISEYLLLSAARRQHLVQIIWPNLFQGRWVICDRFYDSSIAYQGYGRGVSLSFLDEVYYHIAGDFKPHLTIIMKINIENSLTRVEKRNRGFKDRYESMDVSFRHRLIKGYENLAKAYPGRCSMVDASKSIKKVSIFIRNILKKKFNV